jgi:glycopeptide antibiotics resistance protein
MTLYTHRETIEPFRALLVASGACVLIVSISADMFGFGCPGFGLIQSFGLIAGIFLALTGFLKIRLSIDKVWARALSAIYLCIILFSGLRPSSFGHPYYKVLLDMYGSNSKDIFINIVGFIPMGFLFMLSFSEKPIVKRTISVAFIGALISFLLETSQYFFIPGRVSSIVDLITNIIGTLFGIALFFLIENNKVHDAKGIEIKILFSGVD